MPATCKELERVTLEQLAGTLERASGTMRWLLAAVAAVSLLVGGIGIMNITLLSVTERTKEIGLRMAVGARGRDVTRQFLTEAVAISLAGGAVGVVLGIVAIVLHLVARCAGRRWCRRRRCSSRSACRRPWACSSAGIRRAAPPSSTPSTRCVTNRRTVPVLRLLAVSGQIAWKALGRNRLRTWLTTLGVVIGVAAVIAMVALGNGARASVERTLRSAGTSIVQVSAGNFIKGGESMNIASGLGAATTLSRDDADAIRELDNVEHVAAGLRSRTFVVASRRRAAVHRGARHRGRRWPTSTAGPGSTARASPTTTSQASARRGGARAAWPRRRLFGDGVDPGRASA